MSIDDEDMNENEDSVDMDIRRPRRWPAALQPCPRSLTTSFCWLVGHQRDRDIQHPASLSDSEDEGTGGRRNHQDSDAANKTKRKTKRPSIMDGGRHPYTATDEEIFAGAPRRNEPADSKDYITADAMDVDIKGEETSASGLL